MANFNIDRKGYNSKEVDEYIDQLSLKYEERLRQQKDRVASLRNEINTLNTRLANYIDKDEQISKALLFAVEKAEQIENNAKNVYNMEIKRINALYSRWEDLLLEVEKNCPSVNKNGYIDSLMKDFKASIVEVSNTGLTLNTKSIKDELKNHSDQFIKNILNKMDFVVNTKPQPIAEKKTQKPKPSLDLPNITKVIEESRKKNSKAEETSVVDKKEELKQKKKTETTVKPAKSTKAKAEKPDNNTKVTKVEIKKEPVKTLGNMASINERLNKLNLITRVSGMKLRKNESFADNFLNSDDELKANAYSKNFAKKKLEKGKDGGNPFMFVEYPEPNETGFDLKDALNPKEDLDEIMKSFDFFDNE